MDAAVLRVLVQAVGITKTNAQLATLQGGLTGAATAAKQYSAAQSAASRANRTAASTTMKQAEASAAATQVMRRQAKATGAVAAASGASQSAAVKQTAATRALSVEQAKAITKSEALTASTAKAGTHLTKAGTDAKSALTPVVGVLGAGAYAAIKYESAFAGVRKTVDATDRQLEQMSDGIREMSKQTPTSAIELSGIAEAAGQLGIKRTAILGFTRTIADLGVATNLTGEEGASQLARLANITRMSQGDFDRLGSTIVALGNAGASTEADIASMGLRIAGAGAFIGMSEHQILAYANALSSLGIEAEAGGSAISFTFKKINSTVAQGGKNLRELATVAGMTGADFRTAWEKDAAGATATFIEGLGRLKREGKDVPAILDDLGLKGIRVHDTLLRASGGGKLLRESLDLGSKSWKQNSALTKEAEERYKTTESRLKLAKNELIDLGVTIGTVALPAIILLAGGFSDVLPYLLPLIAGFVAFKAALAVGAIVSAVQAIGGLSGAMALLAANPVVAIVVAITALGVAFVIAYKKSETFRNIVNGAWAGIKSVIGTVVAWITGTAVPTIVAAWNWLGENTRGIVAAVLWVANAYKAYATWIINAVLNIVKFLTPVWKAIGEVMLDAVKKAWAGIKQAFTGALTVIKGIIKFFDALFRGDFRGMWDAIKQIFKGGVQLVVGMLRVSTALFRAAIRKIGEVMVAAAKWGWDKLKSAASTFAGGFKDIIVGAFEGAANKVIGFINTIIGAINLIPGVDIGLVGRLGGSGKANNAASDAISRVGKGAQQLAVGGKITRPLAIVGEEAPRHPEYVVPTNPAYRGRALALYNQLGSDLGVRLGDGQVPGYAIGGVIGDTLKGAAKGLVPSPIRGALGAAKDVATAAGLTPGAIIDKLPGIGDLPDWLHGTGDFALDKAKDFIKDKAAAMLPLGGAGVTSGTWKLANKLASKFGLSISSSFRTPSQNAAANGASGSSHMKGSPANPGAHDFIPASWPAAAYATSELGAKWADNHDYGSGLHLHVSWFKKGGILDGLASAASNATAKGQHLPTTGKSRWGQGINARELPSFVKTLWQRSKGMLHTGKAMPGLVRGGTAKGQIDPYTMTKGPGNYAEYRAGADAMHLSDGMLGALAKPGHRDHDYALTTLFHEFAHAAQRPGLGHAMTEGGAELWAHHAAGKVLPKIGIKYDSVNSPWAYQAEVQKVQKTHKPKAWLRDQFGGKGATGSRPSGIGVGALDKIYPEHGLADAPGNAFIGFNAYRRIFETEGATPLEALRFAWIARGEGGGGLFGAYPGIRGDDPGGTKGWGGTQNTPGVWDKNSKTYKLMMRLGGEAALRNPHVGAKVSLSLLREGGWGNWVGTKYWHEAMAQTSAESVLTKGDKAWMAGGKAAAPAIDKVGAPKIPKGKGIIPKALRQVAKAKGKKGRTKAVDAAIKAIKKIGMGGAAAKLDGLNSDVAKYADWAGRAEQLTVPATTDANGKEIPEVPGIVQGQDQAHWLTEQLKALKEQRNTLIRAHEQIVAARDRATRIIENAQRQLGPVLKQRQKAVAALNEAKKIKGDKRRAAAVKAAEHQLAPWTQRRNALQEIIGAASGRRKTLNTTRGDVLADLDRVQGPVAGDLRLKRMSSLPAPGVLGGEIFGVQMQLRDLAAPTSAPGGGTGSNNDELVGLLREQLRIANQRTAVANNQFGILGNLPPLPGFAGLYAQGGSIPAGMWGVAGETGKAEIVHGPATVYSPAQSQAMLAGGGEREIRVVLEDRRAVVYDDGREVEQIVYETVDKMARRGTIKTPGGGRL